VVIDVPMTNITVCLPEECAQKLQQLAASVTTSPQELARIGIRELLAFPQEEFREVVLQGAKHHTQHSEVVPGGIDVSSWEEFEEKLNELRNERAERQKQPGPPPSGLLFRGQENSCWQLATTLERNGQEGIVIADYYRVITAVQPQIETLTGSSWNLPQWPEIRKLLGEYNHQGTALESYEHWLRQGDVYSYLVHLRNHGFPSPLLDLYRGLLCIPACQSE
jgi:hypothetical protein